MKRAAITGLICAAAVAVAVSTTSTAFAARLGIFQHHKDIGVTPKKGKAKYNAKKAEYVITGGGANVWAKTDAFQYVYKQISGDVTLNGGRSLSWTGCRTPSQGNLMIRQSLDSGLGLCRRRAAWCRVDVAAVPAGGRRGYAGDPIESQRTLGNSDRAAWKSVHDWSGPKGRRTDQQADRLR